MNKKVKDALELENISYEIVHHKDLGEIKSAPDFARLKRISVDQVCKTLFLKQKSGAGYVLAVLPVVRKADLKSIARILNTSELEIAPLDELVAITGYERHGTTAIGTDLPVVVDQKVIDQPEIFVGTGEAGEELRIGSEDLMRITKAKLGEITI